MYSINPAIVSHLSNDSILHAIIPKVIPVVEIPKVTLFEHLTRSIISQQLSTRAAATIHKRFKDSFNTPDIFPEQVLAVSTASLRSFGLSGQKASYIHNIAGYFLENNLMATNWHEMSDDDIIDTLIPIKGVGLWTIQMVLIFHLMRDDVFPLDDLAIRNRMITWYKPEGEGKQLMQQLHAIAEQWKPYRSWACRYIWAAGDQL